MSHIVRVTGCPAEPREMDRMVARIAGQNAGRYGTELHRLADPSASRAFIEAHVRRLEAMRKLAGAVEREPDGTWTIAPDHLERAAAFARGQSRKAPSAVETLSRQPLQQQIGADSATRLDRTLVEGGGVEIRNVGFGHEAQAALARRRKWLIGQAAVDREHRLPMTRITGTRL